MSYDNRVCSSCVSDEFLQSLIDASPEIHACDYCEQYRPTFALEYLGLQCDYVIENFYEVTSTSDAVQIYERIPAGHQINDILFDIVSPSEALVNHLVEFLNDHWFDRDIGESIYGDEDPWFIAKTSTHSRLSYSWEQMEENLKTVARYVNPEASKLLELVFGNILGYQSETRESVIRDIGEEYPINRFYRARTFQSLDELEKALGHPELHLGPPPANTQVAGRMNARGISVFYGSTAASMAVAEVRPPIGSYVVVSAFKVIRKLRVLDLFKLGSIFIDPSWSYFDPNTLDQTKRRSFLRELTRKMVSPVMPDSQEKDYLITQAISDYLSTHPTLELDGILFPSALDSLTEHQPTEFNVILFNKASKVSKSESKYGKVIVNLWEYDERPLDPDLRPELTDTESPEDRSPDFNALFSMTPPREASLELDRYSIEINQIQDVTYTWDTKLVNYIDRSKSRPSA